MPVPDDQQKAAKPIKNYRIRNSDWHCPVCEIYCNSQTQFDVHLISQKHKQMDKKKLQPTDNSFCSSDTKLSTDENNNQEDKPKIDIHNFALAESHKINAKIYLIPETKRVGKFEKFGFYCAKCNAYMTGQIQLVMASEAQHVKGAKHQFFSPGEIPGFVPSKVYNPNFKNNKIPNRPHELMGCPQPQPAKKQMPCSTPVKASQMNGSCVDYYSKNQNIIHSQYFPRYYSGNYQSPMYGQYGQQSVFTSPPPTNSVSQNPNGNYYGQYVNQNSPASLHNYRIAQSFRVFPTSQSNVIVVNNDSRGISDASSKPSSYSSASENCLNVSFEKNYPAYSGGFESPVFNLNLQQPRVPSYSNSLSMPTNQSPQLFYQKSSNRYLLNSDSNPVTTAPQVNLAYYQNYSIIS
ncbi:hypothetical protein BpHYR1_051607 [Brachionus plicatilis]|uniref:U1-type domain-containing protein n=1 Tax=Brachionus plicatilis TaxID=10195 RepID=A0A3M7QZN8_BRAPC|nr:hypothetical protein BpHYR1_051607 [Brachionus plicatilis]